jgi:YVTN family beta-propeller protein
MTSHEITFSGDGCKAYVTNQMANTLSVIDIRRHAVKTTIGVGTKPNGLVWREDESED